MDDDRLYIADIGDNGERAGLRHRLLLRRPAGQRRHAHLPRLRLRLPRRSARRRDAAGERARAGFYFVTKGAEGGSLRRARQSDPRGRQPADAGSARRRRSSPTARSCPTATGSRCCTYVSVEMLDAEQVPGGGQAPTPLQPQGESHHDGPRRRDRCWSAARATVEGVRDRGTMTERRQRRPPPRRSSPTAASRIRATCPRTIAATANTGRSRARHPARGGTRRGRGPRGRRGRRSGPQSPEPRRPDPLDHPVDAAGQWADVVGFDVGEHADPQLVAAELAVRLGVDHAVGPQRAPRRRPRRRRRSRWWPPPASGGRVGDERHGVRRVLGPGVDPARRLGGAGRGERQTALAVQPVELISAAGTGWRWPGCSGSGSAASW